MSALYNADTISEFFDAYGLKEWDRLVSTPADRVSLHIHTHYLKEYVGAGDRVLEAGAGPGRFTLELAKLGARVVVGDISRKQLDLNERHVTQADCEEAVEARTRLDVTNLSQFGDASFDRVVCYGGPISYAMDRGDEAVRELLRVLKPGGHLLSSVMSLVGATRIFLEGILGLERFPDLVDRVSRDGILTGEANNGHPLKLYRYAEFKNLLGRHGAMVVAASAANLISAGRTEGLEPFLGTPVWERFLAWERDYCAEGGAVDCGTHILTVARKDDR